VDKVKKAALDVLLHNIHGPHNDLPRTAGWGYPEPYTRDWMISALGILVSKNEELIDSLRRMLSALAKNQTRRGHIPSLAHEATDCGASDTTPLFLIALALFQDVMGEPDFLAGAAQKALVWLEYQSPDDAVMIAQQPTSDWRDEQWVWGYGLYVNTLLYACLRLHGHDERAEALKELINRAGVREIHDERRIHEGLSLRGKPFYALWVYKGHFSERFDLLGNSLAILFGLTGRARAKEICAWVENSCADLQERGELASSLPPCLIPYIQPGDPDWLPRYRRYNQPGDYHNGGVWPFISGFYIAALVASGQHALAKEKLAALTDLVRPANSIKGAFGFNEWFRAQDCRPYGQDWQTWTAAMYLYAAACVEGKKALLFTERFP
jgi:hypothetical protein